MANKKEMVKLLKTTTEDFKKISLEFTAKFDLVVKERNELRKKLQKKSTSEKQQLKEISELKKREKVLEKEIKGLNKDNDYLKESLSKAQVRVTMVEHELEEVKNLCKCDSLANADKKKRSQLEEVIPGLMDKNVRLESRCRHLEEEKCRLEKENQEKMTENQSLQSELNGIVGKLDKVEKDYQDLLTVKKKLEITLETQKCQLGSCKKMLDALDKQIRNKEIVKVADFEAKGNSNSVVEDQMKFFKAKCKNLEVALDVKNKILKKLMIQIMNLTYISQSKSSQVGRLNELLINERHKIQTLHESLEMLKVPQDVSNDSNLEKMKTQLDVHMKQNIDDSVLLLQSNQKITVLEQQNRLLKARAKELSSKKQRKVIKKVSKAKKVETPEIEDGENDADSSFEEIEEGQINVL